MGLLIYGAGDEYDIDDRVLAHVKVAIAALLEKRPAFLVNWTIDASAGAGRVSLLISQNIPLQFFFNGHRPPALNPDWIRAMIATAQGQRGMIIIPEAAAVDPLVRDPDAPPDPVAYKGGARSRR